MAGCQVIKQGDWYVMFYIGFRLLLQREVGVGIPVIPQGAFYVFADAIEVDRGQLRLRLRAPREGRRGLWELAKLHQIGRIDVDLEDPEVVRALSRIHVWPIDLAVCQKLRALDFEGEPADELIAVTSIVHGAPLVTRDSTIRKSKLVPLAC